MISVDRSVVLQVINFLILLWVLNKLLYRPIRQILSKRKETFLSLEQKIDTFLKDADDKDSAYEDGLKAALAEGVREKKAYLKAAAEEEKKIIDQINRKNQENFVAVQTKVLRDAEAAKADLRKEVDAFADAISQKILGRVVS